MITINLTNSTPYVYGSGMAVKVIGNSLPEIKEDVVLDFCICNFVCDYVGKVFAKIGGEDFENDRTSFIFQKLIPADTVSMKLFKNNIEIATLNDDTYGTFFNFGDITPQPLYTGYLLEWEKVFALHGSGTYQIKTDTDIVGNATTVESQKFFLLPFSEEEANGTVRLEWIQNGNILSSLFDFTGINWYQSIRFEGNFGRKKPSLEKDFYETQNRERKQIQDNVITTYTLETKLLPSKISNKLYYDMGLANSILISDYNIFNNEIFRQKEVDTESYEEPEYFSRNTSGSHNLIFTDRFQIDKKRNF